MRRGQRAVRGEAGEDRESEAANHKPSKEMRGYLRDEAELPETSLVADQLLHFLWRYRRPIRPIELYGALADAMQLDQTQRDAKRRTRDELAWHNRVQTAREHLARLGFIGHSRRGFWSLTAAGREEAKRREEAPDRLKDSAL